MQLTRREFLGSAAAACLASPAWAQSGKRDLTPPRIILAAGDYELALAILDSRTKLPNVRLAIAGRTEDGWYPLGTIKVERVPGRIPSSRPAP